MGHLFDALGLDIHDYPGEDPDCDAVVASNGGLAYVYLQNRQGRWADAPDFERDVLPVGRAFWEAHTTGRFAEEVQGALAGVLIRDVEKDGWHTRYQALTPNGEIISLGTWFSETCTLANMQTCKLTNSMPIPSIAMVEARLDEIKDGRLLAWLADHYEANEDAAGALKLQLRCWGEGHPDLELYQTLERLAKSLNRWDSLRHLSLKDIAGKKKWGILADIHLYEEDWDAAWDVAEQGSQRSRWGWRLGVMEKVAQATEKHRPRKAIRFYLARVQQLVDQRGRKNYTQAARYLVKVRQMSKNLAEMNAWERTLAEIREKNNNLPAFQDELNQAGL